MITLKIDSSVYNVDLSEYSKYVDWHDFVKYFAQDPGVNHNKLLSYLVRQLPSGEVHDLGTYLGQSAIALSTNPLVTVYTYDIEEHIPDYVTTSYKNKSNIIQIKGDCKNYISTMISSNLILLDISPHDGSQERRIISELTRMEYKGLLICDDIYYSEEMRNFWEWVELKKIDATKYGHHSGTGLVIFDPSYLDIQMD
jgi:hypothetical protein